MGSFGSIAGGGASWGIWDLHVHTPASIVQNYGGDNEEVWEKFFTDLENLPPEVTVIGISDYWFLDGYQKVIDAKKSGRLSKIQQIFPVIEMRLDQFGGSQNSLSRVNLHVIFDPELSAETITTQFMGALSSNMKLTPGLDGIRWSGVISRESLTDLGNKIIASVPLEQRGNYRDPLFEGFKNLNVSRDDVLAAIRDNTLLAGKALVGIGKTEWSDLKWNDQSIGAKKTVINESDFIFSAYEEVSRWSRDVETFRGMNVTHKILDCSDAHHFSDSGQNMRIGACQTWLNTTPTFAGLSYALKEFDRRVYVGLEPPALGRIRSNPERFIQRVRVASDEAEHDLFDHDLPLNPGFVAVVGNKGQGKSALLDCIALGGNSSRYGEFAFLSAKRFLSTSNRKIAKQYRAELEWAAGELRPVNLDEGHDKARPVSVEYLPQAFVERVCNTGPDEENADEFENELRAVLFTHIPESERAGEQTFEALLSQKTLSSREDLVRLRAGLRSSVDEYVAEVTFQKENRRDEIQGRLDSKRGEVAAASDAVTEAESILAELDAQSASSDTLTKLKQESEGIEAKHEELAKSITDNAKGQALVKQHLAQMAAIVRRGEILQQDVASLNEEAEDVIGVSAKPFAHLTVDNPRYVSWKASRDKEIVALQRAKEVLDDELQAVDVERKRIVEGLAAVDGARELARRHVQQTKLRVQTLTGTKNDEESLMGLEGLVERIEASPQKVSDLESQILEQVESIHGVLERQLQEVENLYAPASSFIETSAAVSNAGLEFKAELRILPSWRGVASNLDGRKNGGYQEWLEEMPERLEDTSWEQLEVQLREALDRLGKERGESNAAERNPVDALRSSASLSGFMVEMLDLEWLDVRFGLTGEGLPLAQLSPGQRGLVLALFYLVVDRRTTPLLLDQPEENLDNETIASKLVPAIHEAAGRRQTIVVTHNANLAIVGDADQIVHCRMSDKKFTVSSGSIAELSVAKFAMDVLEGTKPAFDNRRHKYEAFPSLL